MIRVAVPEIESIACAALVAAGATPRVADHVAHATAVAESNGNRICGLYYLESYCTQLGTGRVNGSVDPIVSVPRPGTVIVDAGLGFAQPAFAAGFEQAVTAARTNGVCSFSVAHSHTATSLGYFTEQLAIAGMIAIGATNASPRVAPPGGSRALLGTNPIAMAVPDGEGGIAFQFDFATSAVALGTITMAAARGESIPEGWAVDAEGNPTTDPSAAVAGSMLSAGGHKGYGIGLLVEILAGALTGSNLSADIPPLKTPDGPPHNIGQHYLVIDPSTHADGAFIDRLRRLAELVSDQPGARLPGADRQRASEVDVDEALWARCRELAEA
jgi:(2R)-3-sulfolactate dehydrogenase (NADP+)